MSVTFRLASIEDVDAIMFFMEEHWRKGHVLSYNKELLLHDFLTGCDRINIGLALDGVRLIGIFGYMFYSQCEIPDIAGSLWKVVEDSRYPFLGLKLRQFVLSNVVHRFFAAPGAGLQTKDIYEKIEMNWYQMQHWYRLNKTYALKKFYIASIVDLNDLNDLNDFNDCLCVYNNVFISEIVNEVDILNFPFKYYKKRLPFKDFNYFKRKFIDHPFNKYNILWFSVDGLNALVVFRVQEYEQRKIVRVIDFYGDDVLMASVVLYLDDYVVSIDAEYVDFVEYGLDANFMNDCGWAKVKFDNYSKNIIPNYFYPIIKKNIPIYCVSDRLPEGYKFYMVKGDGDQDRPSVV